MGDTNGSEKSQEVLRVSHISLTKGNAILRDVSFAVQSGEILTLLGPSGAGKSSLLRCLNRLESINDGEIFLRGKEIRTLPVTQLRRRVGMVFQTPALIPGTVRENILQGPKLFGRMLEESECESLVDRVALSKDFLQREVTTLSVGEQQRVALAQVLANRPEVLLMDEPTSALDPTAVTTIENLIRSIHRELHTPILWVTHDVRQARRFGGETLVMVKGQVLAHGNIEDLMQRSDHEMLKRFFAGNMENDQGTKTKGECNDK
ncbi:MAG: ATP-binding cassette domain-containing protein [Nitrospinales bacterium]